MPKGGAVSGKTPNEPKPKSSVKSYSHKKNHRVRFNVGPNSKTNTNGISSCVMSVRASNAQIMKGRRDAPNIYEMLIINYKYGAESKFLEDKYM